MLSDRFGHLFVIHRAIRILCCLLITVSQEDRRSPPQLAQCLPLRLQQVSLLSYRIYYFYVLLVYAYLPMHAVPFSVCCRDSLLYPHSFHPFSLSSRLLLRDVNSHCVSDTVWVKVAVAVADRYDISHYEVYCDPLATTIDQMKDKLCQDHPVSMGALQSQDMKATSNIRFGTAFEGNQLLAELNPPGIGRSIASPIVIIVPNGKQFVCGIDLMLYMSHE